MTEYSKREILKHLDALMICVGNAYNTSHYLLESDMKFIEKQEKIIKELLKETDTGTHEDGLGWNGNGVFCGECSAKTCRGCPNEYIINL